MPTIAIEKPIGALPEIGPIISGIVGWLLLIAFLAAFIFLILGGISWITSGGDKSQVEAARNKILAAVIGLLIVVSTWTLFGLVGDAIGFNPLKGFNFPILYPKP